MQKTNGVEVCADEIILANLALVGKVVAGFRAKGLPHWADPEELEGEGNLALCRAVNEGKTDPALLRNCIHAALVNYIQREERRHRGQVEVEGESHADHTQGSTRLPSGAVVGLVDWQAEESMRVKKIALKDALAQLPDRDRRIMTMYFFGGLGQCEIADKIGITHQAVSEIMAKSVATLRNIMDSACKTGGAI